MIEASGDPSDPIRIDLGTIRREMIRELVPEGQGEELTAEERQRMFLEVNQRMTGIREGLELSAQALEQRAEAAARVAEEAAPVPVPPAAPPVAAAIRVPAGTAGVREKRTRLLTLRVPDT